MATVYELETAVPDHGFTRNLVDTLVVLPESVLYNGVERSRARGAAILRRWRGFVRTCTDQRIIKNGAAMELPGPWD